MTKPSGNGKAVNRILIVGLGSIGSRYVRIIRELYPHIAIAVLRHQGCGDGKAAALGISDCFTTIDDALEFSPDAAVIANPSPMHLAVALPLAKEGVHLLVEKPISSSIDGVRQLIDTCVEQEAKLMTGYNLRFLTTLIRFREYLNQGKVGQVLSVRAEVGQYLPTWRPESDYRKTVSAQKKLGGGVLLELSHEIDYLLWLFGKVEWVKASVLQQSSLEVDVEDAAHLQVGFKRDAAGRQLLALLNMDFVRHDTTRQCVVIGEKGTLRWDGVAGRVDYMAVNDNQWEELCVDKPERDFTYRQELKHFFSCIKTGVTPSVTGEDGRAVLLVVDAARLSSETGQAVLLN